MGSFWILILRKGDKERKDCIERCVVVGPEILRLWDIVNSASKNCRSLIDSSIKNSKKKQKPIKMCISEVL